MVEEEHKREQLDDVGVVAVAYILSDVYKFHLVGERDPLFPEAFRKFLSGITAIDALKVLEAELNFIYEAFYTKALLVHSMVGFLLRFVSVGSVLAALLLFASHQKHGCNEFDVKVTYTLLYGAVALDAVSLLMLIFSDRTCACFHIRCFLKFRKPKLSEAGQKKILCRQLWCRRWSESISRFNYISYCLHKKRRKGGWVEKTLDYIGFREWTHEEKHPILQELWIFIFMQLQRKYRRYLFSSIFEWFIRNNEILRDDRDKWKPFIDVEDSEVSFEKSIMRWHIATTLLFYAADDVDVEQGNGNVDHKNGHDADELHRDFSKLLSDYMLYLLIRQPTMMSALMGGQFEIEWRMCCNRAMEFFHSNTMAEDHDFQIPFIKKLGIRFFTKSEDDGTERNIKLKEACNKFYYGDFTRGTFSNEIFQPAITLTNMLKELQGNKWKIIAQVWVVLLEYAAFNSRSMTHVQQLAKGGEFISLVSMMLTPFNLEKQK